MKKRKYFERELSKRSILYYQIANITIRQEKNGGAWCPKAQISSDIKEYLEVDLQKNHLITWTETQGRFGNGQGQEFAEAFLVEYWRPALNQWIVYKDSRGEKVLTGNSNTYLVVRQRLELPFVATKVRFIPYSEHPRTVCMRVELYGCTWEQNYTVKCTQQLERYREGKLTFNEIQSIILNYAKYVEEEIDYLPYQPPLALHNEAACITVSFDYFCCAFFTSL
ncbi:hypothetical protein WA026_023298 [Henosepilachna vigintioctopunctata]|uniref:F5/8 type C domain-containing protein n=1 Tax=Henosepilachna vigintioctopunctata TaxID=420089 RepID=A0AAW1TS47_9CUCU